MLNVVAPMESLKDTFAQVMPTDDRLCHLLNYRHYSSIFDLGLVALSEVFVPGLTHLPVEVGLDEEVDILSL